MYIEAATAPVLPGLGGRRRQIGGSAAGKKHNWRGQKKKSLPRMKRVYIKLCIDLCSEGVQRGSTYELCSALNSGLREAVADRQLSSRLCSRLCSE